MMTLPHNLCKNKTQEKAYLYDYIDIFSQKVSSLPALFQDIVASGVLCSFGLLVTACPLCWWLLTIPGCGLSKITWTVKKISWIFWVTLADLNFNLSGSFFFVHSYKLFSTGIASGF